MSKTLTIKLVPQLEIQTLDTIIGQLAPAWEKTSNITQVCFDFSAVEFIWPSAIALLTTAILRFQQERIPVKVKRPVSANVDSYLSRMDFYDSVSINVDYPYYRRDSAGRFREVVQVCSEGEGDRVVQEIIDILELNLAGIGLVRDAVQHAFLEIVNNVFHHAHSPTYAVVCAQFYPTKNRIEISVVDSGRGIPASLANNPSLDGKFDSAAEAIELAAQPRVTGRPDYNTGEGLFFSLEFIKENRGIAYIHSQDGILQVQGRQVILKKAALWSGTLVALQFRTNHPVDVKAIFDRHAPPEKDFEWLFNDDF